MPDNPHPLWRQERCERCAEGMPLSCGIHLVNETKPYGHCNSQYPCTAPTEAEYIAYLESQIGEFKAEVRSMQSDVERG